MEYTTEITILNPIKDSSRNATLRGDSKKHEIVSISSETLKDGIKSFVDAITYSLISLNTDINGFNLSEIEIDCGISASGKISIFGSGAEFGSSGSIKFKFKKKDENK